MRYQYVMVLGQERLQQGKHEDAAVSLHQSAVCRSPPLYVYVYVYISRDLDE